MQINLKTQKHLCLQHYAMKCFFMAELKVLGVFALIDHPVTPYHSHQPEQRYFYENCVKNMKLLR